MGASLSPTDRSGKRVCATGDGDGVDNIGRYRPFHPLQKRVHAEQRTTKIANPTTTAVMTLNLREQPKLCLKG